MPALYKFSCFLVGSQSRLIQCGDFLLQEGHEICGVITLDPSVQHWVEENDLRLLRPGRELMGLLKEHPFDYLFSIDNFLIIPDEILTLPRKYAINFHDASLPGYAGVNATNWAIMNQETVHGVTWHIMTDEVDAGDILAQEVFPISNEETALSLNMLCYEKSIQCFTRLIDELAEDRITPTRQNLEDRSYFHLWKRPPAVCTIDWTCTAEEIDALCRGLDYGSYPNSLGLPKLFLGDRGVVVKQTDVLSLESDAAPGTITRVTDETIHVATRTHELVLREFISFDGHSLSPTAFLEASGLGEGDPLPILETQQKDTLSKVNSALCRHEDYWISRLASFEPIEIPYAKRQVSDGNNYPYIESRFSITASVLTSLAVSENPGDFLLAVFLLYFCRIGGKESFDIHVRNDALRQRLSGTEALFASHVPLRIDADLAQKLGAFCETIRETVALTNKRGSYVRDLVLRTPSLRITSNHTFSQRLPAAIERVACLSDYKPEVEADLVIVIPDDGKECIWIYNTAVLDKIAIDRMQEQFTVLLNDIAVGQDCPVAELSILPEQERYKLLEAWNASQGDVTELPSGQEGCMHELFEAQVRLTPKVFAAVFEDKYLTYGQLNDQANRLAHYLRSLGVGPEVRVAICLERSLEMVIGLLGIMKAGGVYVPLDPAYPSERIAFMLEDSEVTVMVTQESLVEQLPTHGAQVVCMDRDWDEIAREQADNPERVTQSHNLVYIIYTSGSTGKPKGVAIPHRALVNFLLSMRRAPGLTDRDVLLSVTTLSFDIAALELYLPLIVGAQVGLVSREMAMDAPRLMAHLEHTGTTVMQATPATWRLLLQAGWRGSPGLKILCGGEAMSRELADELLPRSAEVWNMYGPTETTIWSTVWKVESGDRPILIGRPIANTQVYILDRYLQPTPVGVPGELYIGGDGLAREYFKRPELTAERFIPDPFKTHPMRENRTTERIYKTGDLARWLPDGQIECLGRTDDQVKIRGFRIELGEIEATLSQHPDIRQIVVAVQPDVSGDQQLVAYLIARDTAEPSSSVLQVYLRNRIPEYMIPSSFIVVDALPLTPNGKVDRKALSALSGKQLRVNTTFTSPRTETERKIVQVWQEVLQLEQVGVHDNFFDLGGHSLLALQAHSKLSDLGYQDLAVMDLFQHPTIAALSEFLSQKQPARPSFNRVNDRAKRQKANLTGTNDQSIAIVGMAGRFPGAKNIDAFWDNLRNGVESLTLFSDEELLASGIDSALFNDPQYVRSGSILDDAEWFDAGFFGYSPREAEVVDPQHRVFLECAWEALEHAGYTPECHDGLIGVYAGVGMNSYLKNNLWSNPDFLASVGEYQRMLGNENDYLTTRVSYKLGLRGPSLVIQTACSTSLVAVQVACQGLLGYQCDMALAGGVSVTFPQKKGYLYQEGMIYSPDGHCRPFDAQARGTHFGDGCGIVVLKRLADALEDGDTIHAIIRGAAINNDGSSKVGYTAPSVDGQAEVIAMAQAMGEVNPETITHVEAHGTATPLGDPIEVAALTQAFRAGTERKHFCTIGSVKGNIGHLDTAAGIAGLIKTVLSLKHQAIPPNLHYTEPNHEIDFEHSPFYVNTCLSEWKQGESPRRAGVSAFGIGGTNAHVVLEEAPASIPSTQSRALQVLVLSARTRTALDTATANLAEHLKNHPDVNIGDVAYTLQAGRKVFEHRRMLVCRDSADAFQTLERQDPQRVIDSQQNVTKRPVVFMFSGQGSQYVNMGQELYRTEATFRHYVDQCADMLKPHLGCDLRELLYPAAFSREMLTEAQMDEASRVLSQTAFTQTALFAVEYALARMWMAWGIEPEAMIGHSIGEYVAACIGGAISLEDALTLVAARGRLMQDLPPGAMLAVLKPSHDMAPLLNEHLDLATINGPSLCTVSGSIEAIEELEATLTAQTVGYRRLHTSHAFHSQMMDSILPVFTEQVRRIRLQPSRIPFISNLTGTWITDAEVTDPVYWAHHLRHTVRFSDGITELLKDPGRVLLEVGPGNTLTTFASQTRGGNPSAHDVLPSLPHPREQQSDSHYYAMNTLGKLWLAGVQVDWTAFHDGETNHRIPLPAYPFERKRYWVEPRIQQSAGAEPKQEQGAVEIEHRQSTEGQGSHVQPDLTDDYAFKANGHEQRLREIWKDLLGIEEIGLHDDFFELGGHSLMAVQLFNEIEKMTGKTLPLATLFQAPTIAQLAALLPQEEKAFLASALVPIQTRGSSTPFFCVHGHMGNVLTFADLARHLGSDQPFYGLQSIGLSGNQTPLTRIKAMASQYLEEIRMVQPQGPYNIGGYCFGSLVVLEMAHQLRVQGEEVGLLAMFDLVPIVLPDFVSSTALERYKRYASRDLIERHSAEMSEKSTIERLRYLVIGIARKIKRRMQYTAWIIAHILCARLGRPLPQVFHNIEWANALASKSFKPRPYPGSVTLFLAKKVTEGYSDDPERDWSGLATGEIDAHMIAEDGALMVGSMFETPYVRDLAELLDACLRESQTDARKNGNVEYGDAPHPGPVSSAS